MPGPQQNDPGQLRQWVLTEWTQHLCAAIESMTGEVAVPEDSAAPAAAVGTHVWRQGYSLSPEAWAWVSAPSQTWNAIGGKALEAAGIDDATEADRRGTYQEILNQAMSGLAGSMARHAGVEVFCQNGKEGGDPPDPARWISISAGTATPCLIGLHISGSLISALRGEPAPAPAAAPPKPPSPAAAPLQAPVSSPAPGPLTAPPPPAPPPAPSGRGQTIELLYDVELPVSVSFGRANLPLKEVLKLTSGSIVELNRSVTEPVEVIVNNCVVARGEVVVVEGNYGVRILQIISQRERLRTVR